MSFVKQGRNFLVATVHPLSDLEVAELEKEGLELNLATSKHRAHALEMKLRLAEKEHEEQLRKLRDELKGVRNAHLGTNSLCRGGNCWIYHPFNWLHHEDHGWMSKTPKSDYELIKISHTVQEETIRFQGKLIYDLRKQVEELERFKLMLKFKLLVGKLAYLNLKKRCDTQEEIIKEIEEGAGEQSEDERGL